MATTVTKRVTAVASGGQTVRVPGMSTLNAIWNAWGNSWGPWNSGHSAWLYSWRNTATLADLGHDGRVTASAITASNTKRVTGI